MEYAQQISTLTKEFNQHMYDGSELSGHIHIVTPDSICESIITSHYNEFYKCYPKITIKFSNGDTNEMFRLLESNQADAMLTLDNHTYHPSYVIAKEERVPAHFVTNSKSVFYNKKALSINDIINEPFILTEKGFGYRRAFDDNLAKMSLSI